MNKIKTNSQEEFLIKRYLIWFYKTTKEDLDRINRYYTQNLVDEFVLNRLKDDKDYKKSLEYKGLVDDFEVYKHKKITNADEKKFKDKDKKQVQPQYLYLVKRLAAIEKAIVYFLGKKQLNEIVRMYELEMTRRIIEARDHT